MARGRPVDDLTGQTFGRLTVLRRVESNKRKQSQYVCACSCDRKTELVLPGFALVHGRMKSCGCLRSEWLTRGSVARRTTWQRELTPEGLRSLYHDQQLSTLKIGEMFSVSDETVHRWLKADGVVLRSRSEAAVLRHKNKKLQNDSE